MNIKNNFVSILLCFYNRENFLKEAINSILKQTYKNFELILINDGSTDSSEKIATSFHDKRIKYYYNSLNQGIVYSYNRAIDLAKGNFIAIMDSDDISLPSRIEEQLIFLIKKKIDVCATNIQIYGDGKNKSPKHCFENDNDIKTIMFFGNPIAHPTVLAKSSIFKKYRYTNKYPVGLDFHLWTRMAVDSVKFANINKVLLLSRWHNNQNTQLKSSQNIIDARNICIEYASSFNVMNYYIKKLKKLDLGFRDSLTLNDYIILLISFLKILKNNNANINIFKIYIQQHVYKILPMRPNVFFTTIKFAKKNNIKFLYREYLFMFIQAFLFIGVNSFIFRLVKNIFRIKNSLYAKFLNN